MSLQIEIVRDAMRFIAVRDAWQRLWSRAGAHIFQTHDWISGWVAGVRDRQEIRIQMALAWDGDSLVGIMPCAVYRQPGLRVLQWAAQPFSDYCDCVVDPNYGRSGVLRLLWDGMRQAGGFDLLNFRQVRPDAQCRDFFDAMSEDGGPFQAGSQQEHCMRIDNQWSNGDAFFRSLNKKGRNNHTRGKRILAELRGDVAFQVIEPDQPVDDVPGLKMSVTEVIEDILRLKEAWLRTVDPKSPLLSRDGGLLRSVLDAAWRSGLVKIFLLTCGGKIAAASINFVYAGRMEAYLTAYDAAYERASPGTILIVEYAQWSFDRDLRHVDFLRGEEAFKFRMANAETLISSFSGAQTLVGHLAASGHRWLARRRRRHSALASETDTVLEAVG